MSSLLRCIARNDRGTALIEYSSLILLISIAAIAALTEITLYALIHGKVEFAVKGPARRRTVRIAPLQ